MSVVEELADNEENPTEADLNSQSTEEIISDEDVCEIVNGNKVNEVEKIEYVDLSKADHTDIFNGVIFKFIIGLLIVIILLIFLLIRKKK